MAKIMGKDAKVALGANKVQGMGTWSIEGLTAEQVEDTEFGDNWKTYKFGAKDGGTVSFEGHFDPADETGVQALIEAHNENTNITNLQLHVNDTSYYAPNQTAGYLSPYVATGADTPVSYVNITSLSINADMSGMIGVSFTGKVSGVMVLI